MSDPLIILRNLDLVLVVVALPVFLIAGWPMAGYAAGAGAWIAQRLISQYATRKAKETDDLKKMAGIMTGSMIGRGWLVALTILIVGLAVSDEAGLAAAVLFVVIFTASFTAGIIIRPFDTPHQPTT
ncbi:hypothetical protein [Capillimicrobium parvum]|uniref:Uncharacterized protein n=1 Tax=Capillimicrobium parvum TaxID=2884022 RepID=A0A9E6XVB8_9ACTN|nr:hypothetical protein [Capillimicrobium parvum]UGS35059.1 hypothetical protein DSM104329_01443 [Capillimicrobium parvum]